MSLYSERSERKSRMSRLLVLVWIRSRVGSRVTIDAANDTSMLEFEEGAVHDSRILKRSLFFSISETGRLV